MTTIETLTDTQIRALRAEATMAGDDAMVAICIAAEGKATHCAVSDVGPTRCTVEAVGTEDDCRAACEDDGDDTWQIMRIDGPMPILRRAYHTSGLAWVDMAQHGARMGRAEARAVVVEAINDAEAQSQ